MVTADHYAAFAGLARTQDGRRSGADMRQIDSRVTGRIHVTKHAKRLFQEEGGGGIRGSGGHDRASANRMETAASFDLQSNVSSGGKCPFLPP